MQNNERRWDKQPHIDQIKKRWIFSSTRYVFIKYKNENTKIWTVGIVILILSSIQNLAGLGFFTF